jgi:hypothetical protein
MREPLEWYDEKDDNPPWIKALTEVRRLAPREGWRYHHVQAIIVAIDQYAEAALGNAQCPARCLARVTDYGFRNNPCLLGICAGVSAIVVRVRKIVKLQTHAGDGVVRAGNDEEPIVVELLVRHRDKRLMLAAVDRS